MLLVLGNSDVVSEWVSCGGQLHITLPTLSNSTRVSHYPYSGTVCESSFDVNARMESIYMYYLLVLNKSVYCSNALLRCFEDLLPPTKVILRYHQLNEGILTHR